MHHTVASALICHASPEKGWAGGYRHISPTSKICPQNYHNGVGVSSSWSWLSAELTSKKIYLKKLPPPPMVARLGRKETASMKRCENWNVLLLIIHIMEIYLQFGLTHVHFFFWKQETNRFEDVQDGGGLLPLGGVEESGGYKGSGLSTMVDGTYRGAGRGQVWDSEPRLVAAWRSSWSGT